MTSFAYPAIPPLPPLRIAVGKLPADELLFETNVGVANVRRISAVPELDNDARLSVKGSDSRRVVDLHFSVTRELSDACDSSIDFYLYYRNLVEGQRVALLGAAYEVSELSQNALISRQSRPGEPPVMVANGFNILKFRRITDPTLLKDIGSGEKSIIVPIGGSCWFQLSENGRVRSEQAAVDVTKIAAAKSTGRKALASIHLQHLGKPTDRLYITTSDKSDLDIAEGDTVQLVRDYKFKVRKIVPPDKKRKIVGWIEFTPVYPYGVEDAKKDDKRRGAGRAHSRKKP